MGKDETTPSESEWAIMEIIWGSNTPVTSAAVVHAIQKTSNMMPKMVRVLMSRLCQKGILAYNVDESDARIYNYYPLRTREECMKEKSQRFINSYFSGSLTNAIAALLQTTELTDEQVAELQGILEQSKRKRSNDGTALE